MHFNLEEKIEFLDSLVDGTLAVTHFYEWEVASYGQDSMFGLGGLVGRVHAKGLAECVNKALDLVREEITNG